MAKPTKYEQEIKTLQDEGYLDKTKQYGINDSALISDAGTKKQWYEQSKKYPYARLKSHRDNVVSDRGEGTPEILGIDKALGERANRPWQKYLKDAQEYNKDIDDGNPYYNDDELDELAEYVWKHYGYDSGEDDGMFYDHLLDNMGGDSLDYHRQNAGYISYKPSRWDRMSYSQKVKWLQNYGPKGAGYNQELANAKGDYERLVGRKPEQEERLSNRDLWRERAAILRNSDPNNEYFNRLSQLDDETIDKIIQIFGFNRKGE